MTITLSFSDLAQRLERGDSEAAAILFHRYAHRLIGLARRRLDARVRPRVDADAVANSALRPSADDTRKNRSISMGRMPCGRSWRKSGWPAVG